MKFTGRASYYKTVSEAADIVALVSVGGGYMTSIAGGGVRVFDLFQSSDRMIRGFAFNGIGPVDPTTGDHLGGTTYFDASAEAQFPHPGQYRTAWACAARSSSMPRRSTATRWPRPTGSVTSSIRASAGASLIWNSPFGPLRFDYAVPFKKLSSDTVQNFNFGVSTRF